MTQPQSYPTACRECRKTEGWPVRAQTMVQLTSIRVDLRCRACGHQWTDNLVQATSPDFGFDDIRDLLFSRQADTMKRDRNNPRC